jgi:hypothetical protein
MQVTPDHILAGIDYPTYLAEFKALVAAGKTSGPKQSEELAAYTKLNLVRSERVAKRMVLSDALQLALAALQRPLLWVVLTEPWCGDAAQNVPALWRIAEASPHITLKLLYRHQHEDLMDAYLTNGGRSIPKLICLDANTHEELWTWGPRPANLQAMVMAFKADAQGLTYPKLVERVHKAYADDNTATLQAEFTALLAGAL